LGVFEGPVGAPTGHSKDNKNGNLMPQIYKVMIVFALSMSRRFLNKFLITLLLVAMSACTSKEEDRIARISEPNVKVPKAEFSSKEVTELFLDVCVRNVDDPNYVRKRGAEHRLTRHKTPSPDYYNASRRAEDGGEILLSFGDSTVLWHSADDAGSYDVFNCIVSANVSDAMSPISEEIYEMLVAEPGFTPDAERWAGKQTLTATSQGRNGLLRVRLPYPSFGVSILCAGVPECRHVGSLRFALEIFR